MHISRIAARVEATHRRLYGAPQPTPGENPVLASIRAGESQRIARERADRQARMVRATASHVISPNGRAVFNDGSPVPQPPPGPYRDALLLEDANAELVDHRFTPDGSLQRKP